MGRSIRALGVAAAVFVAAVGVFSGPLRAQQAAPGIWDGVYTAAQAERGKATFNTACIRCHGGDLTGTTAPALKGDRFMTSWGGGTVDQLFSKIRDTMPPNFGTILDDAAKLDIVTYILQVNGYPAGTRELVSDSNVLGGIQIVRQGEQATVQNFSLVQTVGCLARGPNNAWLLTKTAEPMLTREESASSEALTTAATKSLGTETFLLLNVAPFGAAGHEGHKMEARGLVYREPGDSRITLTSLKMVSGSCS